MHCVLVKDNKDQLSTIFLRLKDENKFYEEHAGYPSCPAVCNFRECA